MSSSDIGGLAAEIRQAHDERRQVEPFSSRYAGFDLDMAYDVADAVHMARLEDGAGDHERAGEHEGDGQRHGLRIREDGQLEWETAG